MNRRLLPETPIPSISWDWLIWKVPACLRMRARRQLVRLAAGQDHVNAMLMLSVCYSTGKGTPQDADMAEVWKKKALQLNAEREGDSAPQTQKH